MTSAGSNTKLSPEDRRLHFSAHFRDILAAENARRAAAARISSIKKLAKSEDATFTGQKFDHYLKAHFGEDDQKPVDRLKSDRENLEWMGIIPATSGGDLLAQVDRVDREQVIRGKGFEAGLLNKDKVSGYDGGSADDLLWREGYEAGDAEFKTRVPDIMARVQAATTKEEAPRDDDPFSDGEE